MNEKLLRICNWCNKPSIIIWVQGHGQCSVCKTNLDECCRGEEAPPTTHSLKEVEKEKSKDD